MSVQSDRAGGAATPITGVRTTRIEVLILSTDDELLIELGPVLGDRYRSRPMDRTDGLDELVKGRRAIAVLDTRGGVDARAAYAEFNTRHPAVALIVIAGAEQRAGWESALQRGAIAALLDRDAELPAQFGLALEAATRKLESAPASLAAPQGAEPRTPAAVPWLAIGLGVLAVAAVGGWWLTQNRSPSPAGAAATSGAPAATRPAGGEEQKPAAIEQSVPQLLSAARVAFSEQRYLEPAGNNALDYFQRVLAQDAQNAEAREGVLRLFDIIRARSDAALKAGRLDEAESLLGAVKLVAPDSDLARDLGRSVATEQPRWLANQVRAALAAGNVAQAQKYFDDLSDLTPDRRGLQDLQRALEARQKDVQVDTQIAALRAALTAGNLMEPGAGNAHALWNAIGSADRRGAALQSVQHDYQLALINAAREQIRDAHLDVAERYLGVAAELGGSVELSDARRSLVAAQESAEKAANAARAASVAPAAAKDDAPVAAAAAAAPRYIKPKVKKATEPAYPAQALARQQEGYVDVRFNLSPEGKAYNLGVLQSSPAGVFDEAALAAVKRWTFEPVAAGGGEAPLARLRVTFKLKG
ncbi:MAG: TonB family protein [Steroidobacteraceae bacterium]